MPVIDNPFQISQTVNQSLTDAQANGNLAVLAAGPVDFSTLLAVNNKSAPYSFVLPKNKRIGSSFLTETTGNPTTMSISWFGSTYIPPDADLSATVNVVNSSNVTGNVTATYNNGAAGVGATLTAPAPNVALALDSGPVALGDRVVISAQNSQFQNGLYSLTQLQTALNPWILTRIAGRDTAAGLKAGAFVTDGSTTFMYMQTNPALAVMGVDAVTMDLLPPLVGYGGIISGTTISVAFNGNPLDPLNPNLVGITPILTDLPLLGLPQPPDNVTLPSFAGLNLNLNVQLFGGI